MLFFGTGSPATTLTRDGLRSGLYAAFESLGPRRKIIALPPDFTRYHSYAGSLTELAWEYYGERLTDILPTTGTHFAMTAEEISTMFGSVPQNLFRVHDWKQGLVRIGEVPADFVRAVSEGVVDYAIPFFVDQLLLNGGHDLILSIGQVVPHEVIGISGYNKNVFIGAGGAEGIHKTHFLGAAYGMERIMGRAVNPVTKVLNYVSDHFATTLPIIYVLTVVGTEPDTGVPVVRGLFIGDDIECFRRAAELAVEVNLQLVDTPLRKVVVYLDPQEYKSTWLGNKSIYRTRMAIATGGELIVLAPGVRHFGEDEGIDRLIRNYGYVGSAKVLELVNRNDDLAQNLGAAAHLIHGSPEGRFSVTYCPGRMTSEDMQHVHFGYADLDEMMRRYDPGHLRNGMNVMPGGEEVFFVSNPGLGLWSSRERFQ